MCWLPCTDIYYCITVQLSLRTRVIFVRRHLSEEDVALFLLKKPCSRTYLSDDKKVGASFKLCYKLQPVFVLVNYRLHVNWTLSFGVDSSVQKYLGGFVLVLESLLFAYN